MESSHSNTNTIPTKSSSSDTYVFPSYKNDVSVLGDASKIITTEPITTNGHILFETVVTHLQSSISYAVFTAYVTISELGINGSLCFSATGSSITLETRFSVEKPSASYDEVEFEHIARSQFAIDFLRINCAFESDQLPVPSASTTIISDSKNPTTESALPTSPISPASLSALPTNPISPASLARTKIIIGTTVPIFFIALSTLAIFLLRKYRINRRGLSAARQESSTKDDIPPFFQHKAELHGDQSRHEMEDEHRRQEPVEEIRHQMLADEIRPELEGDHCQHELEAPTVQ